MTKSNLRLNDNTYVLQYKYFKTHELTFARCCWNQTYFKTKMTTYKIITSVDYLFLSLNINCFHANADSLFVILK